MLLLEAVAFGVEMIVCVAVCWFRCMLSFVLLVAVWCCCLMLLVFIACCRCSLLLFVCIAVCN